MSLFCLLTELSRIARGKGVGLLCALSFCVLGPAFAQSPMTLDQVLQSLKSGIPSHAELVAQISQRGANFHIDVVALEQLLAAGATPALIEAIETPPATRPGSSREGVDGLPVFSGEATSGDEGPVTREHILGVLRNNGDQALLAGLVTQYGIAFPYTPVIGREFQDAGANSAVLATIATAIVGSARLPDGFTILPVARAADYTGSERSGRLDIRLHVDGAVELRIQGERVMLKTLQAQPARDAGTESTGRLPLRPLKKLDVAKRDGRGQFVVLQRPSAENNFLAMIRIYDPKGGEDRYHLRILWETE